MSGGVDSSVCAELLKNSFSEVVGAYIIFSDRDDPERARVAAKEADIPLYVIDRREEFKKNVIDYFANTYLEGGTPNPCVICNRFVKMESLCRLSEELGADKYATGHYASPILLDNRRYTVKKGSDLKKDQSYMLSRLEQYQIERFTAPLELYSKDEIKRIALDTKKASASLSESQDICFVEGNDYASYIRENYRDTEKGSFVDKNGRVLGMHEGILNYTVGQRRGLGIALGHRAFVTDIDPLANTVTLAAKEDFTEKSFSVKDLSFLGLPPTDDAEIFAKVKIRYSAGERDARVTIKNQRATVEYDGVSQIAAPGQFAVFYSDDGAVLFSGIIERNKRI